jgi:hypothetical protein
MGRSTLRRVVAAAAAPTLLVAGLTACGSGSDSADETGGADDASQTTGDEPTPGEKVDAAAFAEDLKASFEDATTASMTMEIGTGGGEPLKAEGQVDYSADPAEMAMTMDMAAMGSDGSIDMRIVDGIMYMNMGSMTNDKFVRYDLNDPASLPPEMQGLADQMDPLAAFADFGDAVKTVTFVGQEEVDGEDLDHYTLVMDTAEIPDLQDLPDEAGIPDEIAYDAWFDDDFLFRQMKMRMDMATSVSVDAKFFDWGESVDIEAPADADVVEAAPGGQA